MIVNGRSSDVDSYVGFANIMLNFFDNSVDSLDTVLIPFRHRTRPQVTKGSQMTFLTAHPEMVSAAAVSLQSIGAALSAGNAAAAGPIGGVVPAAADEVSALTAAQFAAHAQRYDAVSARATAIHELFVATLSASAASYAATEAASAAAAF